MKEGGDFHEMMHKGAKELDLHLDDAALDRLHIYFLELRRWSRKMNLIARGSRDEQIIENHFLDSLTLLPLLDGPRAHLLDVGSGAGFPGLVCGIADPAIRLTLVEPRLKRVSFLRHVVRTLMLEKVEVVAGRIEDTALLPSEASFTHITSRAVSDIPSFLEMINRFIYSGEKVICMKGPNWQEECQDLVEMLGFYGLEIVQTKLLNLPYCGAGRTLLVFQRKTGS